MSSNSQVHAYFQGIRGYYKRVSRLLLSKPANVWAINAHAWDLAAGIVLTPIEEAMWHNIRAERAVLYPQYPVGRFFVDFGNPVARVAIECDGAAWHTDVEKDRARHEELHAMGWRVYRISGRGCYAEGYEHEDPETGFVTQELGAGRALIRRVASEHGLIYQPKCDGPRLLADIVAERLAHYEELRGLQ